MHRRHLIGLVTALLLPLPALAQAWPAKGPVRLVDVFPPGGSVDQVARVAPDGHTFAVVFDTHGLRRLAVTTSTRNASLPEVPALAEGGFPGFEAPAWWAVPAHEGQQHQGRLS